jgi:hypothetical protein
MGIESQGCLIRRESSAVGSTGVLSTNTISFVQADNTMNRQAGFADFVVGMRVYSDASLNTGVYTISATDSTKITLYEPIVNQASGVTINLEGHTMQEIGAVYSFNGPNMVANVIDVTHLKSTAKEKMIGLHDPGNVALSLYFNPETSVEIHDGLRVDEVERTKRWFDIKFTDFATASQNQPSAAVFKGYVSGFNLSGAVDNVVRADINITLASGVYWIAAT